jgi:erythromycin esterase-like protein
MGPLETPPEPVPTGAAADASAAEVAAIARAARRITGPADYEPLLERAAKARVVLIGEASHGTQEFYEVRAELTRRLVEEKGFRLVVLEADWPDALRAHRWAKGQSIEADANGALADFQRFPRWMWRNTVMVEFLDWLRKWNRTHKGSTCGLFGMDLYSMHASMALVLDYLDTIDPYAAKRARERYSCFEAFGEDPQQYGLATALGRAESCEAAVVAQMVELRRHYGRLVEAHDPQSEDEYFYAEQNARLVKNAEAYYRSMFRGRDQSWNLRDAHMTETLVALLDHYGHEQNAKAVVWAHNSHLGDARATDMAARGEWNVGQLARELYGERVYSIGFSTHSGTVTAAHDWGDPAQRRRVRPGLPGSCEALFHATGIPAFWLDLREDNEATHLLHAPRLQRAIGVIYRPQTERRSHYFSVRLTEQFDAIVHLETSSALEPLERDSGWVVGELPDTFPEGL